MSGDRGLKSEPLLIELSDEADGENGSSVWTGDDVEGCLVWACDGVEVRTGVSVEMWTCDGVEGRSDSDVTFVLACVCSVHASVHVQTVYSNTHTIMSTTCVMLIPLRRETMLVVAATERAESPLSSTAVTSAPLAIR